MQKRYPTLLFLLFINFTATFAQQPQKPNAAEIYSQIQKLNFLGSVLYLAAHPDDENTRLISYMANEKKARTAYLSLTRGDGGQNLIGPELRELLGAIRTQELLEARKIDGGEQLFSRANDFGYSKNPTETLRIWNKDELLSDVVYLIRKFQPDVIINRFDARSPGTTHGHHTSSAMLGLEAFDLANNSSSFPNQLNLVKPWQPKRIFFNTSWWFYGTKEKFDKADKSNLYNIPTGVYYAAIGKSNQEIAALSRSRHQSQGFGNTGARGDDSEYLELLKGDKPKDDTNIFDGIDTSWNRVKGGKPIGELLSKVALNYDFKNPSASIPNLALAYSLIQNIEDTHWKAIKSEDIKKVIAACAGLYLEVVAEDSESTPGTTIKLKVEAINRSTIPMKLNGIAMLPATTNAFQPIELNNNVSNTFDTVIDLPSTIAFTQPYWLAEQGAVGMYRVDDQKNIGIPDIIREVTVIFNITVSGFSIPFERKVIYKYNDPVKGEVYRPLDIVPEVTTSIADKVLIFNGGKSKRVGVSIKAGTDNLKGEVHLEMPQHWNVNPKSIPFTLAKKGEMQTVYFEIEAPKNGEEATAKCVAVIDGKRFDKEQIGINYDHISRQQILKPSEVSLISLDIKIGKEKIAYIMGAGDEVPKSLQQMGYEVSILKAEALTKEKLEDFDVVMTGIRAYNTIEALAFKQQLLFDFVKQGKTMIVQYNTMGDFVTKDLAPFPLKISRDRVTDEDAVVTFPDPINPILNYPNKITEKDFLGWKQEQGLYYPNEWDKAFTPILSSNDPGESAKKGGLLVAKYGKGHYIYTGISFFRELPEGVSGAFRLMANMISIQTEK